MNHDVVVIGAGVSGLSCAQDLMARGLDVKVLERQVTTGGNAKSSTFDGFLMEHGPTTMNAAFPNAMARISALGLDAAARPLGPNVRKRYLRDENGLHGISAHPMGFFTSGYLSPIERASMLAEFLRPRKSGGTDETIHQFAARRFGKGFADKVIEPMAAGIFMGDSKTLSISGAFPKLVELEQRHGSIIRGILAAKRGSEPGRNLLSWDGGIGTLPQTQTRLLGPRIETGVTVTKITRNPAGFVVATANSGTVTARALVLAVQPHVAAALLEPLDPITAKAAAEISAPPISVVYLGYRREQVAHPLNGLGFLSTKSGGQAISGAQFCSTMFAGRAPANHVSVACYVGGSRNPDLTRLPERDLSNLIEQELAGLLGIKGIPVVARIQHWPRGLPHYTIGHQARRDTIESAHLRLPGLYLTGNYLAGVSLVNCLEAAHNTTEKVAASLLGQQDLRQADPERIRQSNYRG